MARTCCPLRLADDGYLRQAQRPFEPALVRMIGMHLNEYLYYYYYAEQALQAINNSGADPWRGNPRAQHPPGRAVGADRRGARSRARPARLLRLRA